MTIVLKHNDKICGFYDSLPALEKFVNSCINCGFMKKTDKIELEYYNNNSYDLTKTEKYNSTRTLTSKNKNPKTEQKINKKIIKVNKASYEEFSDSDTTSVASLKDIDINTKILDNDTDSDKSVALGNVSESDSSFTLDADAFLKQKQNERDHQHKMIELGQQKLDVLSHINKLKLEKQKMIEKKNKYDYDLNLYYKFKQMKTDDFSFDIPLMFKDKYYLFERLENNNDLSFEAFMDNYVEVHIGTKYDDMFTSEPHAYKLPTPEDFKSDDITSLMSAAF